MKKLILLLIAVCAAGWSQAYEVLVFGDTHYDSAKVRDGDTGK